MLTTSVEPLEGNHIKLTVTVPAEEVDAAIKQSYETLGKKVRIPGFRKGHAPRPVVDNYMGKEYVLSEATEALVDSTYPDGHRRREPASDRRSRRRGSRPRCRRARTTPTSQTSRSAPSSRSRTPTASP